VNRIFAPPGVKSMSEDRPYPRQSESTTFVVQRLAPGKHVVRVAGDLCSDAAWALYRIVADELRRPLVLLVVDLSEVARIDGAAVNALGSAAVLAGESDFSLCLAGLRAGHPVAAALAEAGLMEMFEIFRSPECEG
jgi:anti-anti-sigma regulatory factor